MVKTIENMTRDELISYTKEALKSLSELEKIADEAEQRYDEQPENVELEKAFDVAYKKEYIVYDQICKSISQLINVEYKIARKMVSTQREELISILNRAA